MGASRSTEILEAGSTLASVFVPWVAVMSATWRATSHCNGPWDAMALARSPKKGMPLKGFSSGLFDTGLKPKEALLEYGQRDHPCSPLALHTPTHEVSTIVEYGSTIDRLRC